MTTTQSVSSVNSATLASDTLMDSPRMLDGSEGNAMDNYHNDEQEIRTGLMTQAVFVYPWAIRVWHWVNALAIVVLCVTGYLIGKPLPTQQGEATFLFLMGYIRFIHFTAGYIMAIGFLLRIYMAIVGNHHAREMFSIPFRNRQFWQELLYVMKSYAFMRTLKHRYVGHNPMSRLSMIGFAGLSVFMIMTGFALYGEGTLAGSWANTLFSSWMIPLFGGNSQNLHTFHRLGMWLVILFVMIHVYAAIREEIVGRQSMISTMISGWRFFKD